MTDNKDVNLMDYIKVIFERWKIILYTSLFIGFVAGVISLIVEPVFVSSATIEVKTKGGVSEGLLASAPTELLSLAGISTDVAIESEMEILSCTKVLGNTVDNLGLLIDKTDIPTSPDGKAVIGDIKINESASPGKYVVRFVDDEGNFELLKRGNIISEDSFIGSGKNKERFLGGGFDFVVYKNQPEKGSEVEFEVYERLKHIYRIGNELLSLKSLSSSLINMKITYNDPKLAQQILDSIISEYIDSKFTFKYKALEESLALLGEKIAYVENERERMENKMIDYQKENNVIFYGEDLDPLMSEFASMMSIQAQAEIEKSLNSKYLNLIKEGEVTGQVLPIEVGVGGITVDPHISALNSTIGQLKSELSTLRSIYTDDHPLVKEKIRAINETQEELSETIIYTLNDKIKLYDTRIESIKSNFEKYVDTLPGEQMKLARMYLKIKELGAVYEVLKTTYEAKKLEALQERSRYNMVTVISPPSFVKKPASPKKKLNVLMGLFLGAGIGVVLAFASQFVEWDEYKEKHPVSFWLITLPDKLLGYPFRMYRKIRSKKRR